MSNAKKSVPAKKTNMSNAKQSVSKKKTGNPAIKQPIAIEDTNMSSTEQFTKRMKETISCSKKEMVTTKTFISDDEKDITITKRFTLNTEHGTEDIKNIEDFISAIKKEILCLTDIEPYNYRKIILTKNHFKHIRISNVAESLMRGSLSKNKGNKIYDYFEIRRKDSKETTSDDKFIIKDSKPLVNEYLPKDFITFRSLYEIETMDIEINKFRPIYNLLNNSRFSGYECNIIIDRNNMLVNVFKPFRGISLLIVSLEFKIKDKPLDK